MRYIALSLFVCMLLASLSFATVSNEINIQGYVVDKISQQPLNGPQNMQFIFYNSSTGTNPLWTSSVMSVQVTSGSFYQNLSVPISFDQDLWIVTKIGSETFARQKISPAPYALYANKVAGITYNEITSGVGIGTDDPDGRLHIVGVGGNQANGLVINTTHGGVELMFQGSEYANIQSWSPLFISTVDQPVSINTGAGEGVNIVNNNVGIGTTDPQGTLDVVGDICLNGVCQSTWPSGGTADTRCDTSGTCSQVCIGTNCKSSWPAGTSPWTVAGVSGSYIYYTQGKFLGLGTATPSYGLDVNTSTNTLARFSRNDQTALTVFSTDNDVITHVESRTGSILKVGVTNGPIMTLGVSPSGDIISVSAPLKLPKYTLPSSVTCDYQTEGSMIYVTNGNFYGCDGYTWVLLN
ncbi:MAG: hypothetical protein ABIA21_03365 [Candidatus Aenigmatarchaeota archaeon]